MFRHERPQKGRYRQFHQIGVEALGFAGPDIDAEQIVMCARLWKKLGVRDVALQLNTLGDAASRQRHREKLIAYFEQHKDVLDADAQRRLYSNPLRILDTKNPAMQDLVSAAPKLMDELEEEALQHFEAVQAILKQHGIAFEINPRLVRGLDYYNRTVFEWVTPDWVRKARSVPAGACGLIDRSGNPPATGLRWLVLAIGRRRNARRKWMCMWCIRANWPAGWPARWRSGCATTGCACCCTAAAAASSRK
jgi:histidyl-tRNA synthetase